TVINGGAADVYLIDTAFRVGPGGVELRPDALRVAYEAPDTAVLASKLLPPAPNALWATPPRAYGTRLAAGKRYQERFGAPLPLRPAGARPRVGPDGSPLAEDVRPVLCRKVHFELGVIRDAPELRAEPLVLAGKPVAQLSTAAWKLQEVLTVLAKDVQVPLLGPIGTSSGR